VLSASVTPWWTIFALPSAVYLLLWPPYVIGQAIIFLPCGFFYLSIFFSSPNLSRCRLDVYHTWCGLSTNLRCRSETCCTRLAKSTGHKKIAKNSPSGHHRTTLSGYIFATKGTYRQSGKNLLSSNMSSTCPHNMVNFGPLAADIDPVV